MMKFYIAGAFVTLAACQPQTVVMTDPVPSESIDHGSVEPPPVYGDGWNVLEHWAGEYPHGLSIYRRGITVRARQAPHPSVVRHIDCKLDYLASYHPWNTERTATDGLEFLTAFKTYDMVITKETSVNLNNEAGEGTRILQPGDVVTYVAYYGEGWGEVEIDGERYGAHMNAFEHVENAPPGTSGAAPDDEWLGLPCGDQRGYILLSDVHQVSGISFGMEGMTSYGHMQDLMEDEAAVLRENHP